MIILYRARLLKGLIAYPVDNYNFINMIAQLFIIHTYKYHAFLIPSILLNYR